MSMGEGGRKTDRDVELLFPERTVTVTCPDTKKETDVIVTELSLLDQLTVQAECAALFGALAACCTEEDDPDACRSRGRSERTAISG